MEFGWDPIKETANLAKHGVSFDEAASVFADRCSRTIYDEEHSSDEDRFLTLGFSIHGRLLVVWHTDREGIVRIIGARIANRLEAKEYTNG